MTIKVYVAHALTGRDSADVVAESEDAGFWLEHYGLVPLDPASAEGVREDGGVISAEHDTLSDYWARDKRMIQDAHVLLDLTGPSKSEGVAHEIGYARYGLWKPVVRVWPGLKASIARLEDDLIVNDIYTAGEEIQRLWGTRRKRVVWRLKMLRRCLLKWIWLQINEFK